MGENQVKTLLGMQEKSVLTQKSFGSEKITQDASTRLGVIECIHEQ